MMKTIIITLAIVVTIFVTLQSYTIMSTTKTEEQKYTVIHKYEDLEIRFYPPATIATIHSTAKTYKDLSGPGFQQLAGYIFGGNEGQNKIAMTKPVHMNINDSISTMSFVMPSVYNEGNLPKPIDPNVCIEKTTAEYVAAIEFGGFASEKELKHYSAKLLQSLKEKGISPVGHFRFLGYNPPFQLLNRRNEIIVGIEWKEK